MLLQWYHSLSIIFVQLGQSFILGSVSLYFYCRKSIWLVIINSLMWMTAIFGASCCRCCGKGPLNRRCWYEYAAVTVDKCADWCSGGERSWHVFYHFVGAVPGSTELLGLLCRLLYEMKALPVSSDEACLTLTVTDSLQSLQQPTSYNLTLRSLSSSSVSHHRRSLWTDRLLTLLCLFN